MIKIILKEMAFVKNLPLHLMKKVKEDLIFDNPIYINALRSGNRYIAPGISRYVYLYNPMGESALYVPRGYMSSLLTHIGNEEVEIIDRTTAPELSTPLSFTQVLRDYQEEATSVVLSRKYGILDAATGAGKTASGIYTITQRNVKTLILVHTKELLKQWTEALKFFTNIDKVGNIGNSKYDIQDVTVGIIKSVNNHIEELKGIFGYLICDEVHRSMGDSWIKVINSLNVRYQLGLSATTYRRDTLSKGLFVLVGPMLHIVDKKYLEDTGAVLVPKIIRKNTEFSIPNRQGLDYSTVVGYLTENYARNSQIVDDIAKDLHSFGEPIMVVSDRVSHCELLLNEIKLVQGASPVLVHGQLPKKERDDAVLGIKDGRYNILIATFPLLSEGFDSPSLNALFMTTPASFQGRVQQVVGRILRPSKSNATPRVYDYRDIKMETLMASGRKRDTMYRKAGWI